MATGDLKNNLKKLHSELKKVQLPENMLNLKGLAAGDVTAYLGIYDYLFRWNNSHLSKEINDKGLTLPSVDPSDPTKFLEGVYLILRDMFSWKPPLTVVQLKSSSFVERKIIMCSEIIKLVTSYRCGPPKVTGTNQLHLAHSGIRMIKKHSTAISCTLKETPAPKRERNATADASNNIHSNGPRRSPSETLLLTSKRKSEIASGLYQTAALKSENEKAQPKSILKVMQETFSEKLTKIEEVIQSLEERLSKIEVMMEAINLPVGSEEHNDCNGISSDISDTLSIEPKLSDKDYIISSSSDAKKLENGLSVDSTEELLTQ